MQKKVVTILSLAVYLVLGLIIFVVFSHIRPMLPASLDWIGRICLIIILLIISLLVRANKKLHQHWPVFYAYFVAALAMAIDYNLPSSKWLLSVLNIPMQTPAGLALDKLDSSLIIVICIILLTKLSDTSLGSIFLQKGHLRKGLSIGIIAFLVSVSGSFFVAVLFGAQDLTLARIIPWMPWIAIFILGNAFNEELLFRGLFLNKIGLVTSKLLANLVLVLPFVLHHTGIDYSNDTLLFLAYLIPLAFIWGLIMQKTDSIWGSVLFHAGTDIPVVLVIFSRLSTSS